MKGKLKLTIYFLFFVAGIGSACFAQAATQIYRSAGPSATNALDSGSVTDTLTISGTTAAFSTAVIDSVGVGDVIQFDISGTYYLAFIHGRTDSRTYTVASVSGGAPQAVSGNINWNIYRAYTSLYNAESGRENDTLNDTVENFDDWTAGGGIDDDEVGKDLTLSTGSDEQWNIACYNGQGGVADTVPAGFNGWTTASDNFIRVYTPTDLTEAGANQRHSGKWDTGKYRLEALDTGALSSEEDYFRVDGLQLKTTRSSSSGNGFGTGGLGLINAANDIRISNMVIKATLTGTAGGSGIAIYDNSSNVSIWNCAIYNFVNGTNDAYGINANQGNIVNVYSTTIYNCYTGVLRTLSTFTAKNVGVAGCNTAFSGTITQVTCSTSTPTFVSTTAGSEDLHLQASDTTWKNLGTDTSGESAPLGFTTDIDSQSRSGLNWDIGADEATFNGPFTMEAWVKPRAIPASQAIIAKAEEMRVATDADGKPLCQIKGNFTWQTAASSGDALVANQWAHVSCTYDQANLKIHVNGVEKGSQPLTVGVDNMTSNWKIGTDDSSDGIYGEWNGLVDDFRFYNYARAADELVEDFNAGHPAGGSPISSPFTDYNFDEGVSSSAYNKGSGGSIFNGTLQPGSGGSNTSATQMWSLDGVNGKAVELDGTDDKVDLPDVGY